MKVLLLSVVCLSATVSAFHVHAPLRLLRPAKATSPPVTPLQKLPSAAARAPRVPVAQASSQGVLAGSLPPNTIVVCDEVQCDTIELEDDRLAQFRVSPRRAYITSAIIVTIATALQIITPGWMVGQLGACDSGLSAAALGCVSFLNDMKTTNPVGLVLGHGIITKACADVLAQTIPKQEESKVWIDSLRVFRSMLASILSTSLPFYWWTRFMAASMPVAPVAITGLLGVGLGTAFFKTVVTQALFRPVNVFLFLFLQAVFRGDSARQIQEGIRTKIKSSVAGGIAFYSVSNMLMYSVPVPFLHPIMGSCAGLVFNVWLAIVAYRK